MRINGKTFDIAAHNPSLRVYNCSVDVVRITTVTTSTGKAESRTTLATDWQGAIEWKSGAEKILFDKTTYFQDAVLLCRVIPGETVTTNDRIVYQGNDYEIVDVVDIDNLGRRLRIALRRVV